MGRLSHREIHLHHASEIGLEGVERRPTFGLTLTIAEDVELLLRVGERPDLLLTLGAKVPQVGRDDSNRRIWHQPPNVDGSASGELGRDVNAVRVKERLLIGRAVHDRPTHGEYARQRIRDASARQPIKIEQPGGVHVESQFDSLAGGGNVHGHGSAVYGVLSC
jgi:hypothetical protein